jgi:uncharacterized protein YbaR (Trm112 family)
MKKILLPLLVCPVCLPQENRLNETIAKEKGSDIEEGSLCCPVCGTTYAIKDGIADLIPPAIAPPAAAPPPAGL